MAGFTSTFPFKPLLSSSAPKPSLLSLSSFDSKLFGLRISNPDFFNSTSHFSALRCSISARYGGASGGGSSRSGSGDYRRSKQSNSDDDQALDMSTVRSDTVRLIDAQQNMVGVVSKNEAVQMALDAELDLVILSPDADPPVVRIMDYKYNMHSQTFFCFLFLMVDAL
ncbi:hypothetical protein CsSME_00008202 [Camellia sinensis var. sinensis]